MRSRRAPAATVLADRAPLFRGAQLLEPRANSAAITASNAVTVPVWAGSF
jgi:hypothetical protein